MTKGNGHKWNQSWAKKATGETLEADDESAVECRGATAVGGRGGNALMQVIARRSD